MFRDVDHTLFRQQHVFAEDTVDCATERAGHRRGADCAVGPVLKKTPGDTIARRDSGNTPADGHDLAGAVGVGNAGVAERARRGIENGREVAIVQRRRVHFDQNLTCPRLAAGALVQTQRIDALIAYDLPHANGLGNLHAHCLRATRTCAKSQAAESNTGSAVL